MSPIFLVKINCLILVLTFQKHLKLVSELIIPRCACFKVETVAKADSKDLELYARYSRRVGAGRIQFAITFILGWTLEYACEFLFVFDTIRLKLALNIFFDTFEDVHEWNRHGLYAFDWDSFWYEVGFRTLPNYVNRLQILFILVYWKLLKL